VEDDPEPDDGDPDDCDPEEEEADDDVEESVELFALSLPLDPDEDFSGARLSVR
jgi:hypothetical protein